MWNLATFPRICVSAGVFYSWCCESRCMAKDIEDKFMWDDNDEFIHLYKTEMPFIPPTLGHEKNNFSVVAWSAILSVVVSVTIIVCFCCICWKFYTNYYKRRQSSNAALVPPPPTVVTFQTRTNHADIGMRNPPRERGRIYGTGIVNFTFTSAPEESTPNGLPPEDVPPAYTTVVSQMAPNISQFSAQSPHNAVTKAVETPPPSYNMVAPFK